MTTVQKKALAFWGWVLWFGFVYWFFFKYMGDSWVGNLNQWLWLIYFMVLPKTLVGFFLIFDDMSQSKRQFLRKIAK